MRRRDFVFDSLGIPLVFPTGSPRQSLVTTDASVELVVQERSSFREGDVAVVYFVPPSIPYSIIPKTRSLPIYSAGRAI
jgi:hypothetical protein